MNMDTFSLQGLQDKNEKKTKKLLFIIQHVKARDLILFNLYAPPPSSPTSQKKNIYIYI